MDICDHPNLPSSEAIEVVEEARNNKREKNKPSEKKQRKIPYIDMIP